VPKPESAGCRGLLARAIDGALWVYSGGLLAWIVAARSAPAMALGYLGIWLFAPLLAWLPWVAIRGGRSKVLLLAVPVVLFLQHYGPLFVPRPAPAGDPGQAFRVLTLNVQYTNTDRQAVADTLLAVEADVLALQEVTLFHWQNLTGALGARYAHRAYYGPAGLAVFSRYPILSEELVLLQPWPAQSLVVQVGETQVHLINAHLARVGLLHFLATGDTGLMQASAQARAGQMRQLERAIREMGLPAVMACDCNMTDLNRAYEQVTGFMHDAYRARGWGPGHTFLVPRGLEVPSRINLPVQRLDYLFYTADIQALKARVLKHDSGSDHRAVIAEFDLNPQ
jgi:vancomycin resistance protein VanJ